MVKITDCDNCGADVDYIDVDRHAQVPHAMGYVGIIYDCPQCGVRGKRALRVSQWQDAQQEYKEKERSHALTLAYAGIELDAIDSADDLIMLWASYPGSPPIELGPQRGCNCKDCVRRREQYGI